MKRLKQHLFNRYNGFSDKRIKNLDKGSQFIIDDRKDGDFDAKKNFFLWFCAGYVDVVGDKELELHLSGGVPINSEVVSWISKNSAMLEKSG